jgi:hypothetical protein
VSSAERVTPRQFFARLRWLDGAPLLERMEPYRLQVFDRFFDTFGDDGRLAFNLALCGRAKKNWKTADLVLACFYALFSDSPAGSQVYVAANDEDQADDDLDIAKKLLRHNPDLELMTVVKANVIERRDGDGFIEVLPARDAIGSHGKTFRLFAVDEIHGHRNWDLLEAMAPDPSRLDAQTWITSYASIFHRPGVPLFDLFNAGKLGQDPRMLFSWYAANFTTDPALESATPEERANPSRASWGNPEYLDQQRRRLPAHKYRRLHLNLPGLPEGSAFQPEPVTDAIVRGTVYTPPVDGLDYSAFVDMSGGSSDDATCAIGHRDGGQSVIDRVMNQGAPAPFDPRAAVERFVPVLREYRIASVTLDGYAGNTFRADFERHGFRANVADKSKSAMYEALEPKLNAREVTLPDVPLVEQQLLGLVWRGGRIDHQPGEHDDFSNVVAGLVDLLAPAANSTITVSRTIGHAYAPDVSSVFPTAGGDPTQRRRRDDGVIPAVIRF